MPRIRRRRSKRPPPSPRAAALDQLGRWLAGQRKEIRRQVTVREGRRGGEDRTSIEVDHLLKAAGAGLGKLRVHTQKTFLPRAHFSSEARVCIANAARIESGRAIYCEDPLLGEVIAVIAFHIGRRRGQPILITTIALREDLDSNPALGARSLAAALVLKHYVHAVSERLGRGGHVDIDLAASTQRQLTEDLGFRKAPRVDGFRPGGTHLRQQAPG
jgi:hypothetical protein